MDGITAMGWQQLLAGVSWFALAYFSLAACSVIWTFKWLTSMGHTAFEPEPTTRILLFLPMFRETSIAKQTLDYFSRLDYHPPLVKLVVVTTAREVAGRGTKTTHEVVQEWIAENPDPHYEVLHTHVEGDDTCKADQLNYALQSLGDRLNGWAIPETFVGVYDTDSRPDLRVLREVDTRFRADQSLLVFQQGAVYFHGYDSLHKGIERRFLQTRPFYNMYFCFSREIPGFAQSVFVSKTNSWFVRFLLATPNHFLGHGEFISMRLLALTGGFPPPSADTSLGTILSFLGYPVAPLALLDTGETPSSILSLYKQGITWYSGCVLYLRDLRLALGMGARLRPHHLFMCFKRWLENMIWCLGPLVLFAAIISSISLRLWNYVFLIGIACSIHYATLIYLGLAYERLRKDIITDPPLPSVMSVSRAVDLAVIYPIMMLISCLSPLTYYAYWLRRQLFGKPIPRPKTSRLNDDM